MTIRLGQLGENLAIDYLKARRYKILLRNYKVPFGEIDIIAQEGDTICFIEVKTRKSMRYGHALEVITVVKRQRMIKAALSYIKMKNLWDRKARFDIVSIYCHADGQINIEIIKDAFEVEQSFYNKY